MLVNGSLFVTHRKLTYGIHVIETYPEERYCYLTSSVYHTSDYYYILYLIFSSELYHKKKKECVDLASEINQLKKEIDTVSKSLTGRRKGIRLRTRREKNIKIRAVLKIVPA